MNPEFIAIILAATPGSRLYPLTITGDDDEFDVMDSDDENEGEDVKDQEKKQQPTSNEETKVDSNKEGSTNGVADASDDYLPKHLLPLAGRPILEHLIEKLITSNFKNVIVAISSEDKVTIPCLIAMGAKKAEAPPAAATEIATATATATTGAVNIVQTFHIGTTANVILDVVQLPSDCGGSADALRFISSVKQGVNGDKDSSHVNNDDENNKNNNETSNNTNKDENEQKEEQNDNESIIPNGSHVMVMSADLILYSNLNGNGNHNHNHNQTGDSDIFGTLADVHRQNVNLGIVGNGPPVAMTLLLSDVGETDEHGSPLKESAKAKKGGISREDEDIEYIALSQISSSTKQPTNHSTTSKKAQRIILKQSKFIVEDDEDNTGNTPKLHIPKFRLHPPMNQILIRTDWNDVHLFCFAPWVLKLIGTKVHLKDLSKEVVPLLVESQFKGVKACLGITVNDITTVKENKNNPENEQQKDLVLDKKMEVLGQILTENSFNQQHSKDGYGGGDDEFNNTSMLESGDYPFTVLAHTLSHQSSKLILRACNVPSYVYACREVVTQAIKIKSPTTLPPFPEGASVDIKFNSITLQNSSLGDKVQIKSSTIGKNVTVGNRCRLNNVIVMDDVTIGNNCMIQNSILSKGCKVADNCSLNDCQLGPKCSLSVGNKAKNQRYFLSNSGVTSVSEIFT